ncbi:adiponectin receptor [Angomonas deanei]|nr:adiponectin receptor [Angomonas deanei]|eukprot:EPY35867.1 adiponectin receptor [Angomonas deanei]
MVTTLFDVTITASYLHNIKLIYLILCLGSMLCMINSTVYHLFTCHHHYRVFRAMGRLDFLGITALIIASFLPPLYTLFSCHRTIRTVYLITIIVLGMAGIIGPWTRTFHSSTAVRTSIYVGIVASGVVPGIHALFILPFNSVSMPLFKGIVLMLLFYSIGVVFYVMRIPESKFPGHFDYIFSSHQLWHFFVLMAAIVHYFNCLGMYQLMAVSDGQC